MFKITVKTASGAVLTYTHVDSYNYQDGHYKFFDKKESVNVSYPVQSCDIVEEKSGNNIDRSNPKRFG